MLTTTIWGVTALAFVAGCSVGGLYNAKEERDQILLFFGMLVCLFMCVVFNMSIAHTHGW